MAWEWVAPTVTGIVGLAGTTGTVIVAWLGRRHAEAVAQMGVEGNIKAAYIQRRNQIFIEFAQAMRHAAKDAAKIKKGSIAGAIRLGDTLGERTTEVIIYSGDSILKPFEDWTVAFARLCLLQADKLNGGDVHKDAIQATVDLVDELHVKFCEHLHEIVSKDVI